MGKSLFGHSRLMVMLITVRVCIESVKYDAFRELCIWNIQYVMTLIHKAKVYFSEL